MARKWSILCLTLFALAVLAVQSVDVDDDNEERMHPTLPHVPRPRLGEGDDDEFKSDFWNKNAQATIADKIKQKLNVKKAKNIIMFLGDGMSLHTVTATRSFIKGEAEQLSFDKFPHFGLSKTYCIDKQVADSACTATAYLCGVKGNYGTIGVNGHVLRYNCEQALDKSTFTDSIAKWAQDENKATGIVTTSRVTHASPAGVYAHTANRGWENDAQVAKDNCDPKLNIDIAQQLVHWPVGKALNVVLGGGRAEFRDASVSDEQGNPGWRTDKRNLIDEWVDDRKSRGNATYVWNRAGLKAVQSAKTDYLLGLFSAGHCSYHGDLQRNGLTEIEPTLTEMTEAAINVLENNDEGFFLFVEGARIDMAHHDNKARKALEDTEEFAKAVQKARDMTSDDDTLIVVTSDHAHTMTINGYPTRGSDVLGLAGGSGSDGLKYTTLSYANGPGFFNTYMADGGGRRNVENDDFTDANLLYAATVPLDSETHGGDDVGIFAAGPYSHMFVGTYEQNNIPLLMAYASKIGPYRSGSATVAGTLALVVASLISLRFLV